MASKDLYHFTMNTHKKIRFDTIVLDTGDSRGHEYQK